MFMVIVVLHQGSGIPHGPSCTPKCTLELTLLVCKCAYPYFPTGHFRGRGIFVLCQIDNKQE